MRVSFNELDSYALANKLNTKNIIDDTDTRIGDGYNNPSFDMGLLSAQRYKTVISQYKHVPQTLIQAIVSQIQLGKTLLLMKYLNKNLM